MSSNLHRNSTEANKHTPKGFDLADNNSTLLRDERGQSRYIDNLVNERVENLVDGFNAPPTTTSGHLYVLIDNGSGTVNTDWNGANYNDIVRIQDGVWVNITPVNGYLVFNKTDEKYYKFGSTGWAEFGGSVVWGNITGTLSDQTDLQSELDAKQDTLVSGVNIRTINGQTLLGSTDIVINSENIYTDNGTIGSGRVATLTDTLSFSGGRVSFDTTDNGILLPRLTTVQMNAIASPATNLLVFNTDLNGLYRYNGSSWVALAVGYGIIGVYSGSGNGTPTFFADLQSALETCKASGGYFTVKLYSNITITSAVEIDYTGTGVGNAYLFRQLTIDFNGFSVTNAQANTSNAFTINLSNSISVYQEVRFVNGNVFRTNGTGTHFGLFADGYGTIQMEKMYWFCQNHITARIHTQISTANQSNRITDLGGSTFISQTHTALAQNDNTVGAQNIRNFNAISYGAQPTVRAIEGVLSDFTSENTSTGIALNLEATAKAERFYAKSNSGYCVNISGGLVRSFRAISVTGRAVNISTSGNRCDVDDFYCETGNSYALFADNDARITNGKCVNNGATDCVRLFVFNSATNIEATNLGSGVGMNILNLFGGRTEVVNCTAISFGGIGGIIDAQSSQICHVDNCNFVSDWNNAGGHALRVTTATGGTIKLTKCNLKVKNASANAINATSAVTVRSRYCTHNDVATTPINANVTIVSSGIIS